MDKRFERIWSDLKRILMLFGMVKATDQDEKYIEYVEHRRKSSNLRRSMILAFLLIFMCFLSFLIPPFLLEPKELLSVVLIGEIILLSTYLVIVRRAYSSFEKNPDSKIYKFLASAVPTAFWTAYYPLLSFFVRIVHDPTANLVAWMAFMLVGVCTHVCNKNEGLIIFPVSFISIVLYLSHLEIQPFVIVACCPIVIFLFIIAQMNNVDRLAGFYRQAQIEEVAYTGKRRLGSIFSKVFDVALEIDLGTGKYEVLNSNDPDGYLKNHKTIDLTQLFEYTIEHSHPDDHQIFAKNLNYDYLSNEFIRGRNQIYFEGRMMTSEKEFKWISVLLSKENISEEDKYVLCLVQNIDERKHLEDKLRLEAERDPLTKLYNKTTTKSLIEECIEKDSSAQHALIIIDLDNFKTINDTRGHAAGDQILLAFTTALNKNFRETDILGRAGGDEFVVLIKNVQSVAMVCDKLQRLTSSFKKYGIDNGFPGRLSCSIGVAMYNKDGKTYDELFKKADAALYEAKRNGKDQYKFSITRS